MSEANGWFEGNNALSLLVLADSIYRRDRAAPVPRPLPSGMGSRIGIPRRAAGPMGQARLAKQTRTVVAEPGRILGCALVATSTIGGRHVSRSAFRFANAVEKSRIYFGRRRHAGAGDWREYCHFQRRQCADNATAPIPQPGAARLGGLRIE